MDDRQSFTPIFLQPHDFRKDPDLSNLMIAAPDLFVLKTLGMGLSKLLGYTLDLLPLSIPQNESGLFNFTLPNACRTIR
jgi:hypothetical protein